MENNNLVKCEVSAIHNGQRHPAWLLLPRGNMEHLYNLYSAANSDLIGGNISGLSFIELPARSTDQSSGDVDELVSILKDNIEADDEQDSPWPGIDALAEAVSKEVKESQVAQEICVEFIWDVGGGDDNIFTQSFQGVPNGKATQEFIDAMEKLGEETGGYYDFITYNPTSGHVQDIGIDELVDLANKGDQPQVSDFFHTLQSMDMRLRLLDIAHTPSVPSSPPKPKF